MATAGYIIVAEDGRPMHHSEHTGYLYRSGGRSSPVTLFNTRDTAERAIERTHAFAEEKDLSWAAREYRVKRVAPYESPFRRTP